MRCCVFLIFQLMLPSPSIIALIDELSRPSVLVERPCFAVICPPGRPPSIPSFMLLTANSGVLKIVGGFQKFVGDNCCHYQCWASAKKVVLVLAEFFSETIFPFIASSLVLHGTGPRTGLLVY